MDIKQSIEQKVNQTVEHLISDFEDKYIAYIIGNDVIKVKVKLDAKISSVEFDTDSKEPVINNLVDELNMDYRFPNLKSMFVVSNMFYGSKSNPMLQIDDRYFLCMVGMPHQVTRLEYNSPLTAMFMPNAPAYNLSDGDWVYTNRGDMDVSSFALVYRDELYFWNFSQVEHEPITEIMYTKLIF